MNHLGAALRAWRDRLDPASAGITRTSTRRVPGLRREELATLAGVSAEYVTRLEQGRAVTPSVHVCTALGRVLRLSQTERDHLLRLAGHATGPDRVPKHIPESLHRIAQRLAASPLTIFDALWRPLHWNPLFTTVFGEPPTAAGDPRSLLVWQFEDRLEQTRQTTAQRAAFEASLIADLRATAGRFPHDPDVDALLTRLHDSARFRTLWSRPALTDHQSARKTIRHPQAGEISLESSVLTVHDSSLRLVVYTPVPETDAARKLALLA
ncbi:transcriptional regulator with XRE-family HTH domain [Catenuloplanes nepalensis]|uniref:Transcriptional regulator with XRE-family HTH domain n=1 Tax=Catenuloplanes nepalensis TaxID=587533 RepID=A0ABT9N013_9ACTN|nr:helix-turn-helix transcriptional regulator [Catenuloplanes nepalensis]MDP9796596.1 transcriptional regulator with XRE-family HTH domain [Catenuloplanes nepalensis]